MSSLFGIAGNGASEFYTEKINQSLRFDGDAKLLRTPSSDGNRKKWTTSFWLKRAKLGVLQYLWSGASYSGNDGIAAIYINSDDKIHTYFDTSGSNPYGAVNDRVYRDITNWYHFVWAVDAENTVQRIWINGVEETLSSSRNPPNYAYGMNKAGTSQGFGVSTWGGAPSLDGYLANIVHLDGQYLDETYFGETKNGVWVPKAISGLTFGTNGFHLDFSDSSSVGNDISGNNNDYTPTSLLSTDVVIDTPTNNFCTLNPLNANDHRGEGSFSRANLRMTSGSTSRGFTSGTMKIHGKVYFEVLSRDGNNGFVGINDIENSAVSNGQTLDMYNGTPRIDGSAGSNTGTFNDGDIMGVAVDVDAKSIQFFRNNSSVHSASYSTDAEYFPIIHDSSGGRSSDFVANFGQDSSFTGEKTAQGNTDSNGQGDFYYTPPSGFLALCSANLPDTNLAPNQAEQATDYFNTVIYTGNNTSRSIAVGFQPDWTWIKSRSATSDHYVFDSNRGTPNKSLSTNDSGTEDTTSGQFTQFTATGFDLPADAAGYVNYNSRTYAAWNWKINGGTTSTDNNGTRTSTVQASQTSGISIATFTNTSGNFSFGHGLGSVPEMFWWKSRNNTQNWIVYHPAETTSVPNTAGLYLNSTSGGFATGANWLTELSSTRIAITDGQVSSGSNINHIVYSFKSVEGFSKIGSYTGNGNADGTFVYTGSSVAWVMIKSTSYGSTNWLIFDNVRDTSNSIELELNANNTNQEYNNSRDIDFLSNGFKIRSGSNNNLNTSGGTYLYMAFGDGKTAKLSNAR